ncbi:MAG: hypothetical protein A2Y74_06100 [Actinobacteria bacterium RBG_13_63_9]|nr:MAG: hypothetical protein A2Y74_06100 [Actinobacteria bacterium RBG_13_63_9]
MGLDLLAQLCEYVFRSLADLGFKVIIGVTGHDVEDQVNAMKRALERVKTQYPVEGFMMMEGDLTDFGEHRMDHAGHWETSMLMYLYPDCVDLHQIRTENIKEINPESSDWSDPGIEGKDPRSGNANKELGKRLVQDISEAIANKAVALLSALKDEGKLRLGPPLGGSS